MQLRFLGAARQVTGSMFVLRLEDGYTVLIDCGLDMERPKNGALAQNEESLFPFDPSEINLVLLTHAHIDHSGNIPNLYRLGYRGQVLCTAPTQALTDLLLQDSANINRRKLNGILRRQSTKKGRMKRRNKPNGMENTQISKYYLDAQVAEAMQGFVSIRFNETFEVKENLKVTFIPTGHLLGAASILLEIRENAEVKKIIFSGDTGRKKYPLLVDPQPMPQADYVVCESTYGNREHQAHRVPEEIMEEIIYETCVSIPGRLIIPAFSVGRTQAVLFVLHKLCVQHRLPAVKIFSDSPLALRSTEIYQKYHFLLNQEAKNFQKEHENLFDFKHLVYVENLKKSKEISNYQQPCIIISASGMMEGGRIQHHIRENLQNPYCTIFFTGYASKGTPGHALMNGEREFQIRKRKYSLKARVCSTDVFSGHGDRNDLLGYVKQQSPKKVRKIFLVHGEYQSMQDFKLDLEEVGFKDVILPEKGQAFDL